MKIMFDTSALITLVDSKRPHHETAQKCFARILEKGDTLVISPIAISEYGVKDDPKNIITLDAFEIPDYNIRHAITAATFKRRTMQDNNLRTTENTRVIITNDTQIIAQAHTEGVDYILTEDRETFCKTVENLRQSGLLSLQSLLLGEEPLQKMGYAMEQQELPLQNQ